MNQLVVNVSSIDIYPFILNFASKHTQRAYMRDFDEFFSFLNKRGIIINNPSDLSVIHFIAYRDWMDQTGMTPKTVARRLSSVKSLMDWFFDNGHIKFNPAASLRSRRADVAKPTQALTDEEVVKLLNAPDILTEEGRLHQLLLIFMFMFGLRRSELVQIRFKDIYQSGNHLVLKVTGKGGKVRELPFNGKAKLALESYLKNLVPAIGPDDFLLQNAAKRSISLHTDTVYKLFKRYAKRVGITKCVSPHSARATAITKALETGAVITDVADMAGHSDIKTTQIYWKRRKGLEDSPVHKLDY